MDIEKMPLLDISGEKKKAKKPKPPYIQQDTARSIARAKLLIALSEGEVEASGSGILSDRDIYLDGVPIRNPDGSVNYSVDWEFRKGTTDQDYIPALPVVESENTVGFHVKQSTPFTRTITNDQIDSIRIRLSWPQLVNNKSNGDRVGVTVVYAIDLAVGTGSFQEIQRHTLKEKSTSVYERTHSFDLPRSSAGWRFRVRRITPDQTTDMIQDAFSLEAFTEVIDAKLTYPNTALLYLEFDAEQFSDTPKVSVLMKGKIVRIPENYNPESRTYTGVWDGRWKWAYTDNPVWCCMDMIVSSRFGTGQRLTLENVDKWAMYEISRWCDVLVPDGAGGMEPRHTLNVYLNKPQDAWRILGDISSSFNGVSYWNGQQLELQADMPRDADIIFTRANIVDGTIEYGAIPRKDKYSQVLVKFDNPDNEYETDTVAVNDLALTRRFGVSQTEMAAFGCTRFGEAQRRGKWALASNRFDRTISFKTGLDGRLPKIGRIFGVADNHLAGASIGGRISSVGERDGFYVIFLDRDQQARAGDKLIINLPSGSSESRTITAVNGRGVEVDSPFSSVASGMQWAIDSDRLAVQYYKVINIAQDSNMQYTIKGVEYNSGKFDYVDNGADFDQRPITQTPATEQAPPTDLKIDQYNYTEQGLSVTNITFSWSPAKNANYYEVEWRKDNLHWVNMPRTTLSSVDVEGVYSGAYEFRVRAVSPQEVASSFVMSDLKQIAGKVGDPPKLAYLRTISKVMGIQLEWGFPAEGADDAAFVEIHYAAAPDDTIANLLGEYSYPTNTHTLMGLANATELYFKGRIVDRSGNIGAWSDWSYGTSSMDSDEILSYIDGQIGKTQLDDFLKGQIDNIENVSVDIDNINAEVDSLNNLIEHLEMQLSDITGSQIWEPSQEYLSGSLVQHEGALYRAKQDVPAGAPVTNETYWDKVGDYASIGEAVVALSAQVNNMQVSVDEATGAVSAQADTLTTLVARARGERADGEKADALRGYETQAAITVQQRVEATDKEALAERLTLIDASMGDTSAKLSTLESAFVSEVQSTAQRIEQLNASLASTNSNLQGVANSVQLLQSEVTDLDGKITANAEMTTTLSATLRGSRSDGEKADALDGWVAQANYAQSVKVQATDSESAVERMEQLQANIGGNTAAIQNEATVRASADSSLSSQISTVQASVGSNTAAIQNEATVRADADSALSSQISIVSAKAGDNEAAVQVVSQAQASTDGKLSSLWGVRMRQGSDGKWVTAGIGLGIENVDGVDQSQFIVDANLFAVRQGVSGSQETVFAVQDGQTILRSALIGDATITMLKIGGDLYSTNYVAGISGWKLSRDGELEFNATYAGQGRIRLNSDGLYVYDAINEFPRVEIGRLTV